MPVLRPYQEEAVGRFAERIGSVPRGGLIVLPTGSGKSLVMAEIAEWWKANGKGGIGIISHRKELVRQNADEYDAIVGIPGACIKEQGADHRATLEDWERVRHGGVISFTVQTLQNRRIQKVSRDAIGLLLVDECFTGDTEILTEHGFVRFDELDAVTKVAQFDGGEISFVMPTDYICNDYCGFMARIYSDRACDLMMTPGHEVLVWSEYQGWRKQKVSDVCFNNLKKMFVAGKSTGSNRKLTPWERLMIATQADGSNHSKSKKLPFSSITFSFSKDRKILRFIELMKDGDFAWSECKDRSAHGNTKARRRFLVKKLSGASKNLWDHFRIKDIGYELAREIVEEMASWDGHVSGRRPYARYYSSCDKRQADFFQAVALIAGYKTNMTVQHDNRKKSFSSVYRVFVMTDTDKIKCGSIKKQAVPYEGKVYCVSVPSGNIIVRRNGKPLVVGNCHRIKKEGQYIKVREHFNCKWVGLTATPDRADGQKLVGPMFDECWYGDQKGQQLFDFIREGWLTPPVVRHVHVASLQWKWLKGRSGKDFTNEQVSKVWQDYESIQKFVAPILQEVGSRKTLYFCPNVSEAKAVADVINATLSPRRAAEYVASYQIDADGNRSDYPKRLRSAIIKSIGTPGSDLQHLANVSVFSEGTNIPILSAIGWLRFTRSRPFASQGIGRILRAWPGVLDGLERATAAARRAAIANSPKPNAIVFDPTKRAGIKLPLVHVIDVLLPDLNEEVRERAMTLIARKRDGEEYDPRELVEEAVRLESPLLKGIRAALLEIRPDIQYKMVEVDPYSGQQGVAWSEKPKEPEKVIGDSSEKQKKIIKMLAPKEYSPDFYEGLSRRQAGIIIDKMMNDPPVGWIMRKLSGLGITQIPTTNKQGLDLLRKGREQR